jgi:cell division protein FtsZ
VKAPVPEQPAPQAVVEPVAPEPPKQEIQFEIKIEEEEILPLETQIVYENEDMEIRNRVKEIVSKEPEQELPPPAEAIRFELSMDAEDDEQDAEDPSFNMEEQELRIEQHIQRIKELKNLNVTINSPGGIRDLEKEPAYKRRNKKLNDVPHSSESQVSRLTLFEDAASKTGIRTNNSFLHDNVD